MGMHLLQLMWVTVKFRGDLSSVLGGWTTVKERTTTNATQEGNAEVQNSTCGIAEGRDVK